MPDPIITPEISKVTLPSGNQYQIKDLTARELIAQLQQNAVFLGVTTTNLVEGEPNPVIVINGNDVTARTGDWTITNDEKKEFIYNGECWQEFGDMSDLGSLAYKDSAEATYTPSGSIGGQTFTGSAVSYTPAGTNSGGDVTLSKTTIGSITSVGTLPSATMPTFTVSDETLIIGASSWSAGTLPTSSEVTVATDVDTITQPTFSGTAAQITAEGSVSQAVFTGTEATITVS